MEHKEQLKCPLCGYKMPVYFDEKSKCMGIFVRCKGRNCRKIFEIKITNVK